MICPKCGAANSELALKCFRCDAELRIFKPILEGIFPANNVVILASIGQRALATLTDFLITCVAIGICSISLQSIFGMTDQGATGISFYPVVWLYNALGESSAISATPGKMIFRIAVVDLKGQKISFGKATLRIFLKLITGFGIFGIFHAINGGKRQAFHDHWAGTVVLQKPRADL
jgi:uncharacterized RDD family membrane protein YckC